MENKASVTLTISYEGISEARADLILPSLLAFVKLLEEVAKEEGEELEVIIVKAKKGSFEVDIVLFLEYAERLLSIAEKLLVVLILLKYLMREDSNTTEQKDHDYVKIAIELLKKRPQIVTLIINFLSPLEKHENMQSLKISVKSEMPMRIKEIEVKMDELGKEIEKEIPAKINKLIGNPKNAGRFRKRKGR